MSLTIESPSIKEGQPIPKRHTEDGEDLSPQLDWTKLPPETKELALIVDDPDAPRAEPWVHWLIYKIPADSGGLSEGVPQTERPSQPAGALQGKTTWGTVGYRGPAPPKGHGTHHYHFTLYALDAALDLKPGLDKQGLLDAISGHVLGHGELVGTYKR
jgi:Raf kinase inhibitor-like YbhB/YbcL family protein